MDVIRRFIPQAARHLLPGGWLALEIGIQQDQQTEALLRDAGLTDLLTLKDLSGISRFPTARRSANPDS